MGLLVRHEMKSPGEWDRFMRFMERYAEAEEDFGVDIPQLDTRLYIECGTLGGKYDFTNPGYILFLINGRRPEMTRGFTAGVGSRHRRLLVWRA